jgi:hypothetical protein
MDIASNALNIRALLSPAPESQVLRPDTAGDPGGRAGRSIVKGLQSRSFYPA